MSRRITKISVRLHPEKTTALPIEEIRMILRGADDIIARGGRTLLCRILKGSKEKKVLELKLNLSPAYGYLHELSNEEVLGKIDWLIEHNFLHYEYFGRLPLLVYSPIGWEIEKETYTNELYELFNKMVEVGDTSFDFTRLKDRDRGMIFLLLEKIRNRGDARFISLLSNWEKVDYKKVQQRIHSIIRSIQERTG
ncbi:MAG: RQC-minor-1 family DNA-binding protein [bacterium]